MPKMSDHEEYLDSTLVENGDRVVLLDEGAFREPEETGLRRTVFQIGVGLPDQRRKTWTMNKTTRKRLAKAYGDDSAKWVNREVRIEILKQNVRGEVKDVIYGHPVEGVSIQHQGKIDSPASRINKIIELIVQSTGHSKKDIASMIAVEMENSGRFFGEDTAAVIVARNLGVDLEASGERIA